MDTAKKTLTIGIPAYNEEANIRNLIEALLAQNLGDNLALEKIIVVSDGSTDDTVKAAESTGSGKVTVIDKRERQGAYKAQNLICETTDSDALIMLNADIIPAGKNFIRELARPIFKDENTGLTSAKMIPAKPRTFFEKIMANGYAVKFRAFSGTYGGNNLYNCVGVARAFSRQLYSKIRWPEGLPEDAYSYMFCLENGMRFVYADRAQLVFRTPSNLKDHIKQSTRFFGGRQKMVAVFGEDAVMHAYHIPLSALFESLIYYGIRHPVLTTGYAAVILFIKFILPKSYRAQWDIAVSTKEVITSEDYVIR